ncbi:Retrovirus-related Pol polyprotein, partial [Mucuna pruriens]
MISIFSNLLEECMEVFMDDFTIYAESFEACLDNLARVLRRCIDSNLILNFEKCHQVLEKLVGKSHFCFLDDSHSTDGSTQDHFYMSVRDICIYKDVVWALQCFEHFLEMLDQHLLEPLRGMHEESFEACLGNLARVLRRCIDSNLVLNFEKCHFMVTKGIVLGHLVSARGIEVDKAKIDVIPSLSNPAFVWEVRSFLGQAVYQGFQQDRPASIQVAIEGCQLRKLKRRLTFAPILQAPNWENLFELMCDVSNSVLGAILG